MKIEYRCTDRAFEYDVIINSTRIGNLLRDGADSFILIWYIDSNSENVDYGISSIAARSSEELEEKILSTIKTMFN